MKPLLTLSELCLLIVDCEHKTAPLSPDGYPSIRTPNVGRGRLKLDGVNRVDEPTYKAWTKRAVPQQNDLIVAREAPLGNVAIIPKELQVCLGQRTVLIRPDPHKIEPTFLCYFLLGEYVQSRFQAAAIGATVPHLNMRDIRNLPIPQLPSRRGQERIASILGAYDDLIEINRRRIALLENTARRLFEEWFIRFRLPSAEGSKLSQSALGMVPANWTVASIDDLCLRVTDGAHKSPASTDEGIPMASVKDMRDWDFDLAGCRKISQNDFLELMRNDCKPLKGDVLIAKDGSYLKHAFLVRQERELAILSSIAILRPNGRLRPNLFVQFLSHPSVRERLKGSVSGAAIPRIVLKDFKRFLLPIPPEDQQDIWERTAAPMLHLCWTLTQANTNLNKQRDLLLPRLISGELSVSATERELEAVA